MMDHLMEEVRRAALQILANHRTDTRAGIVDSYDPDAYAVKVRLQPEGVVTGWLPVLSNFVGNGWGMVGAPTPGDVVDVHFQEGGREAGFVSQRFFGDRARPPGPCPSGEFWLVHKSGSLLKFHNDGSVELVAATNLTAKATNTLRLEGDVVHVHANTLYRFDTNGHGQAWYGNHVDTWQIGEVGGTPHNIAPPEIPV